MSKRLIVSILLAWLPLQGIAAYTMPFCRHALHAPAVEAAHGVHQPADHRGHAHPVHAGIDQPASDQPADWADCNDCGACRLACAPAMLPASVSNSAVVGRAGPEPSPYLAPPVLVLDRPSPPPLARG